jgi:hypothetical protein
VQSRQAEEARRREIAARVEEQARLEEARRLVRSHGDARERLTAGDLVLASLRSLAR